MKSDLAQRLRVLLESIEPLILNVIVLLTTLFMFFKFVTAEWRNL